MTESDQLSTNRERYSVGYQGASVLMGERSAAIEASFFLPHLSEGWSVLDCGCGPGTITLGIAECVEPGIVVGIDISEGEVTRAADNAARSSVQNVEFQAAGVYTLPFDDSTFDAVWSSALLEHLSEPERALNEMKRVLKPGGLIGVRDIDYGGHLWPPSTRIGRLLDILVPLHRLNGGNAKFGRELPRVLRQTGFKHIRHSASYQSVGASLANISARSYLKQDTNVEMLVKAGVSDRAEIAALLEEANLWGDDPDFFMFFAWFEAVAWKSNEP